MLLWVHTSVVKNMYVFNICRDFLPSLISRRQAGKRKTRTANSAHNSSLFLYFLRSLNINRARFAAGWKRNFSLLRHTLYHKNKSLSIVFFNFSDYFFFRFSNFFAFCLRICNGYVSKPCCGYEPPGVLCPDAEAAHCDISTC